MNEQIKKPEEQMTTAEEATQEVNSVPEDDKTTTKRKFTKKKFAIIAASAAVIVAVVLVCLIPSKFERVKHDCVHMVGIISGGKDYFTLDTYPIEEYGELNPTMQALLMEGKEENTLAAIRYANEKFGFSGAVYSKMLQTSAMMGRQSEENNKYKVSWTYHPDEGLEVTYEKK